jgi:hypothetical protein
MKKLNNEMINLINSFNIEMINSIIKELNKIIQDNADLNPIDLYNKLYLAIEDINNDAQYNHSFSISEDVLTHVEEYIEPYFNKAIKEFEILAKNIQESTNTNELEENYKKYEEAKSKEPFSNYFNIDININQNEKRVIK